MRWMYVVIAAGLLVASPAGAVDYPLVPGIIEKDTTPAEREIYLRVLKAMEKACPDWLKDVPWDQVVKGSNLAGSMPNKTPAVAQVSISRPGEAWGEVDPVWKALGWRAAVSVYVHPPEGSPVAFLVGAGDRVGIASDTSQNRGFWTFRLNEVVGRYTFREVPEMGFLSTLK